MIETRGGFLISQIKQIQGRIFGRLLVEAGIEEFNGAQGRILYVLWQEDRAFPLALGASGRQLRGRELSAHAAQRCLLPAEEV